MKYMFLLLLLTAVLGAQDFESFPESRRYDLADAYSRVADRFDELEQSERAESYRSMAQIIYPGFSRNERPAETIRPAEPVPSAYTNPVPDDSAGRDASVYYFNKLLRGAFNANISLMLSAMNDTVYLPGFDEGADRKFIASELEWFFSEYDVTVLSPDDVFVMSSLEPQRLENGFWRLDVQTRPEYASAVPEMPFWSEQMGFYFRQFPEGWRLAAIGPA